MDAMHQEQRQFYPSLYRHSIEEGVFKLQTQENAFSALAPAEAR